MTRYVLGRLLQIVPVLFGVSVIVFLLIRLIPAATPPRLSSAAAPPRSCARAWAISCGVARLPRTSRGGVAGDQPDQQEDDHADPEEHRNDLEQPAEDVAGHRALSMACYFSIAPRSTGSATPVM